MASRRDLLFGAAAAGTSLALGCREARAPDATAPASAKGDDVTATEDLMREHGVLQRVLLVYDECARRLEAPTTETLPPDVLPAAASLVHAFVHDYHERLEEDAIFPRCERALAHVALVRTLRDQHAIGRKITAYVEQASPRDRKKLAAALRSFNRMYRAHSSREDTVLFPALRDLLEPEDLEAIGEQFEQRERALFGEDGFTRKVVEVSELESALDLGDLARLSPSDFK